MSSSSSRHRDTQTDLLEAARAAVKDQGDKAIADVVAASSVPHRKRIGFYAVVALAGLVLLILQPAWLSGPTAVPPETVAVSAASLRLTLLRERDRVFQYIRQRGRLPDSLADAGGSLADLHYERTGAGEFLLTGHAGDSMIVLRSRDSVKAFLGTALRVIKNRAVQ
jgi:hypothetical protein